MDNKKVIDKVAKLIRLAEDKGATEGEADNAMRMAHKLLAKYNLSMADVADSEKDELGELQFVFRNRPWVRRTIGAIARMYFCSYMVHMSDKRTKTRHSVFGREANVITTQMMAEFVVKSIKKEAGKNRRRLGRDSHYETSFCEGASCRVVERIKKMMDAAKMDKQELSSGKELALIDVYKQAELENMAFMDLKHDTKAISTTSRPVRDARGFNQGAEFGDKINLNQQLEGNKSSNRIK